MSYKKVSKILQNKLDGFLFLQLYMNMKENIIELFIITVAIAWLLLGCATQKNKLGFDDGFGMHPIVIYEPVIICPVK